MKSAIEQLSTYKSVHLNKDNIKTHFIGIPLIIWSVALLLNMINFDIHFSENIHTVGLATIVGGIACIYYFILSIPLAVLVILLFGPIVASTNYFVGSDYLVAIAISVFVVGWILQFIGHAYEKAKPAFVDDLNQLLIGPLFLIAEIYLALGLDKDMEEKIQELAIKKRKAFEESKVVAG